MTPDQWPFLFSIVNIVVGGALIWGIMFLAFKHRKHVLAMRHRERILALEKGIEVQPELPVMNRTFIRRGLMWLFVGLGLSLFFIAMWLVERDPDLLGVSTLGLIPAGVGAAYLLVPARNPVGGEAAVIREINPR